MGNRCQVRILHRLLPAYDEYIISYKDRTDILDPAHHANAFNRFGTFHPVVLYNGHAVGNWKKVKRAKSINIETTFWDSGFHVDGEPLARARDKFSCYINYYHD